MIESPSYRDPAEQGQTLSEKAVDVHIIDGVEVLARWYHSPCDADLMIWFDSENEIARFQLNSSGQIVDWTAIDGIQTGLIVEIEMAPKIASELAKIREDVAETIQFDSKVNPGTVALARLVLSHSTAIKDSVRHVLLACLDDSRSKPSRSRLVQARSRFWRRFKHWTTGA